MDSDLQFLNDVMITARKTVQEDVKAALVKSYIRGCPARIAIGDYSNEMKVYARSLLAGCDVRDDGDGYYILASLPVKTQTNTVYEMFRGVENPQN